MATHLITRTWKVFSTKQIHVELSSKCTLKCPRCPRTELDLDNLNQEFSFEEFVSAFDASVLSSVSKMIFCGDVGDPIYAKDFLKIVEYIKQTSKTKLSIVTNGSYKTADWWNKLGQLLGPEDQVTFSLDGWNQESNAKYRVNSDWDSIILGIQALRASSQCLMNWSMIYFNFNEDHVDQMKQMAQGLGFDTFDTVCSSKFDGRYLNNGQDPLKPSRVAQGTQYERTRFILRRAPVATNEDAVKKHNWAKCINCEKELFVNVDGLLFPCPWFNSGYQNNQFVQKYQDRINVKHRGLYTVLQDPLWNELIELFDTDPLEVCRIKCKNAK